MQGSVCVTDAQTFLNIYNLLPAVERQITHADIVIVNKSSMVGAETIEKIHEIIKEKNTEAAIYDTDFCKVDMQHAIFELTNHKKEAEETTNAVSDRAAYPCSQRRYSRSAGSAGRPSAQCDALSLSN